MTTREFLRDRYSTIIGQIATKGRGKPRVIAMVICSAGHIAPTISPTTRMAMSSVAETG